MFERKKKPQPKSYLRCPYCGDAPIIVTSACSAALKQQLSHGKHSDGSQSHTPKSNHSPKQYSNTTIRTSQT